MPKNPPEGYTRITPYLLYEDVDAALAFLERAFGFETRMRIPGPDGRTSHAEAELAGGAVMMGQPGPDYRGPRHRGGPTVLVHVYVDDVDAHCARAREAGATIVTPLEDRFYGDRVYQAEDPEGHRWWFATHVRDVTLVEMGAG